MVPRWYLDGDEDAVIPAADIAALAAGLPRAETATIRSAGHLPNLERPSAFTSAVAAFLERHDWPGLAARQAPDLDGCR